MRQVKNPISRVGAVTLRSVTMPLLSIRKLQSQSDAVRAELVKVFGDGLQFDLEMKPQSPASDDQAVVIALGVLLGLSMLGCIVAVALIIG